MIPEARSRMPDARCRPRLSGIRYLVSGIVALATVALATPPPLPYLYRLKHDAQPGPVRIAWTEDGSTWQILTNYSGSATGVVVSVTSAAPQFLGRDTNGVAFVVTGQRLGVDTNSLGYIERLPKP